MNRAILLGTLGRDPQSRLSSAGNSVVVLSLATNNEPESKTDWHRVVLFGALADSARQSLKRGSLVYVEGRLQTRKWVDKERGERQVTEVAAALLKVFGQGCDEKSPQTANPRGAGTLAPDAKSTGPRAFKTPAMTWEEIQRDIPF